MGHLKSVHGPLVYDAPADAGPMPSRYVQHHVLPDPPLPPAFYSWRWDRDLVTEISFEDTDHLRAATSSTYYLDVLRPDEGRFVDNASVRALVAAEPEQPASAGDAAFKLFVYLKHGGQPGPFDRRWAEAQAEVAGHCIAQAARRPIQTPAASPAFVDGLWSLGFAQREEAETFACERLAPTLDHFGDALDRTNGFLVLAEVFSVDRLRLENARDMTGRERRPSPSDRPSPTVRLT